MKIETTRFGSITLEEGQVYDIEIHGFSGNTEWALIDDKIGEPFKWLQSLSMSELAFIVIDPSEVLQTYHFSIKKEHVKELDAPDTESLWILCIVCMAPNPLDVTVNLTGPLVINRKSRKGKQIIVDDQSVRAPLFTDSYKGGIEGLVKHENMRAGARALVMDQHEKGRL